MSNNTLSIQHYKQKINQYSVLEHHEEIELIRKYKTEKCEKAFNRIINGYLRLVVSIVEKHFKRKYSSIDTLDMISSGNIGLIIALNKFDLSKEVRFATYANWWIIAKIQEFIVSNISIIKQNQKKVHKTLFTSDKSISIIPDLSLDTPISDSNISQIDLLSHNAISQEEFIIYQEENKKNMNILNSVWNTLNQREKYIIYHRFIASEKKALRVIAEEFNISSERVRQIENRIKKYIKNVMTGKILLDKKQNLLKS